MDFEEIQERLKVITKSPPKPIPDSDMAKFRKNITDKCPKSVKLYQRFKNSIAGGSQHQLALKDPFVVTIVLPSFFRSSTIFIISSLVLIFGLVI